MIGTLNDEQVMNDLLDSPGTWAVVGCSPQAASVSYGVARTLHEHGHLLYGGGGRPTGLLCGGFALDGGASHPLLRALPPAMVIHGSGGRPTPWLAASLAMLSAETDSNAPGAEEVVTRLADAMLTQALRIALNELRDNDHARVRALRDPHWPESVR